MVDDEIGCVTITESLPRYKICTFVNSSGSATLRQSSIVSQGERGVVVFFPQEGVRPRYLSSSPEATLSQVSGRASDLNYVFPSEARLATRDLFALWKKKEVSERVLYLVCKPSWEGLKSASDELAAELNRDTSKVYVHKRLAERTIPFGGLGLPDNKAWCVTFVLDQKDV